jgi:hypothetical protein
MHIKNTLPHNQFSGMVKVEERPRLVAWMVVEVTTLIPQCSLVSFFLLGVNGNTTVECGGTKQQEL